MKTITLKEHKQIIRQIKEDYNCNRARSNMKKIKKELPNLIKKIEYLQSLID